MLAQNINKSRRRAVRNTNKKYPPSFRALHTPKYPEAFHCMPLVVLAFAHFCFIDFDYDAWATNSEVFWFQSRRHDAAEMRVINQNCFTTMPRITLCERNRRLTQPEVSKMENGVDWQP